MPTDLRSHLIIVASFFRYCLGGKKNVRPRSLDRVPAERSQSSKRRNQCQEDSGLELAPRAKPMSRATLGSFFPLARVRRSEYGIHHSFRRHGVFEGRFGWLFRVD